MKDRIVIDGKMCRKVQLMLAGGASVAEAAEIIGVSPATVSRIRTAGFDAAKYAENTEKRRKSERRSREPEQETAEEQVPGQMEMELVQASERPIVPDTVTKMMRFQAGQIDKLVLKLDHINDTLSMILRAIRHE